jgi:transposase
MGRVNTPTLTAGQRIELELGFREGISHSFRMRCHSILLKSEGRTSKDVGMIVGMRNVSVDHWVKRYKDEGFSGLFTRPGRGRKSIMQAEDKESVLSAVKANRQRLQTAKAEWERSSGKKVSRNTFKNFLRSLAEDING